MNKKGYFVTFSDNTFSRYQWSFEDLYRWSFKTRSHFLDSTFYHQGRGMLIKIGLFSWSWTLLFEFGDYFLRSSDFYFGGNFFISQLNSNIKIKALFNFFFLLTLSKDQGNLTRSSSLLSAINKKPRKPQKSNSNSKR